MPLIQTVALDDAPPQLRALYDADLAAQGYVAHYTEIMSLRPDVIASWRSLIATIRKHMRLRRYELVTIAAAGALHCRYCMLAHAAVLCKNGFESEQVAALLRNPADAGLEPAEVAIMALAEKVTLAAHSATAQDMDELRGHGLADAEILDVVLAASARCFFSKTLDALGAEPDAIYDQLAPEIHAAVGEVMHADALA